MYVRGTDVELPVSASLMPSNLSVIFVNGKLYTGVIHKGEFVIACPAFAENAENAIINRVVPKLSPQQVILQGGWIWSEHPLLVLTTPRAIQIYDWDGAILLHTQQMPAASVALDGTSFFRGIVGLPSGRICVGMHSGEILVLSLKDSNNLAIIEEDRLQWFPSAVRAMSSSHSDIVAADDDGRIIVGKDADILLNTMSINSYGSGITCVECFRDHTIAGYSSGHIRIFNNTDGRIIAEVCAHARKLSGLDIAKASGMLLSVSEDTFVRIWKLDFTTKTPIEHKFNHSETNALLCGGRFKDPTGSGFYSTAYDVPAIYTYSL